MSETIETMLNENFNYADVLLKYHIDINKHAKKQLQHICSENQMDYNKIVQTLELQPKSEKSLSSYSITHLIDTIFSEYHVFFYKYSAILDFRFAKCVQKLGDRVTEFLAMYDIFSQLREELVVHMNDEEEVLFPALRSQIEHGATELIKEELAHDHHHIESLIYRIEDLMNETANVQKEHDYVQKLMDDLKKVLINIKKHIYIEHHILLKQNL